MSVNLLARGAAMLARRLGDAGAVPVIYARRGVAPVPLLAVPGLSLAPSLAPNGVPGRRDSSERDYLITAAELLAVPGLLEPRAGDRVTETIGGVACVFELSPSAAGTAWTWSDHTRLTYRVHTKRTDL